ncbi:MAG: glycosyltransferase [Bacteroidales bacterium]|jgi:glycosyltransferase involved in cell wall biosynthesis|nr:glycosyltransferase [Bacteroidales bacterium]
MEKPLISVITVVYNSEKFIERTILSVINQSYTNIEYTIIDGASTDNTVGIIKKYSKHLVYWMSEPDKGIYDAMNKGINHIHGKWIIFMNSGDVFHSNQVVENVFHQNIPENKLVIYGNTIVDYVRFQKIRIAANPSKLWKGMIFYHQSSFTRTDILKKYCFDISYHIAAEYNFFISIWDDFGEDVFYKTNIFISCYDFDGLSNVNRIKSLQERRKILKTKHLLSIAKQFYYLYLMLRTIVVLHVKKIIKA